MSNSVAGLLDELKPAMSAKRKEFYFYLFTTAIEGGTSDWATCDDYEWFDDRGVQNLDGFFAILESSEDDWGVEEAYVTEVGHVVPITETQSLKVDLDVMVRGWDMFMAKVMEATREERWLNNPSANFSNSYFRGAVVQYLTDMEDGDSDATVADLVVQFGLFGEHVYA